MVIAVDFDGTIVEHRYPEIGDERPFAIETLKKLAEHRHKLVLWTMREGQLLDDALEWCKARGLEFYAVNSDNSDRFNIAKDSNYSCKLNADVFIDDRNVGGLPDWGTIYQIIMSGKTYQQVLRSRLNHEMGQLEEPPAPKWMFWKSNRSRH